MKLATLFCAVVTSAVTVMGYHNPIIPGFNPDPSIIRIGEDYFLATSSFEFFPGIPIYHSKDLIKWDVIGHGLNRPSQLNMRGTAPSGGMFAPTLRYHKGRTYLIGTWFDIISPPDNVTRTPRSMFVHTDNIFDETKWSDPIYVDQHGFDPDLFFDDDGKVYLTTTFGSTELGHPDSGYFALWTSEIDIETGDNVHEAVFNHQSPLDNPKLTEGAHIFRHGGKYHMITADSGTDVNHKEMHYRSDSVYGPWEPNPNNPILFNGKNMSLPVLSTGHMDLVQTPKGDWYAVFLATRPQNPTNSTGKSQLGRETFLAPASWTKDGWLQINDGNFITEDMPGLYALARPQAWEDDFKGKFADKGYYTQRTPYQAFHKFKKGGGLSLRGNVYTLDDRETPAAFFRKQQDFNVVWSTEMDFTPTTEQHEAGVTIFLSTWYHNEIGVTIKPNSTHRVIVAKTRTGDNAMLSTTYAEDIPAKGKVKLFIKATTANYSLGYAVGNDEPKYIASLDAGWLQAFVAGWQNFVGAHFGIYATGNQLPILQTADFSYVKTELL